MAKRKSITLIDPKGVEYATNDRTETNTLLARGYKVKAAPKRAPAPPAAPPKSDK